MKENEDKPLEKLVDRMMKDRVLETPSFDFTSQVMSKVLVTKTSKITEFKPLISKPVLIGIIGGIFALTIYSALYGNSEANNWFAHFDFSLWFKNNSTYINTSKTTTYSIVLCTFFLLVQISILKNYFDKKFEI
jgi:H+/Cl- antiporter ClcA